MPDGHEEHEDHAADDEAILQTEEHRLVEGEKAGIVVLSSMMIVLGRHTD